MKTFPSFVIVAALLLGSCGKKTSPTLQTHTFTKQQWLPGITNAVSSLKLHFNDYTPTKHQFEQDDEDAYQHPNSSTISLNNLALPFDIPVTRQDPYSIYINDMNSSSLTTDAHDGQAFVKVNFEDSGTEIIGDCVNNIVCICGSPKLDLTNIVALIPLNFSPGNNGGVSITAGGATFTSGISESGPCVDNACAFFCDILAPNKNSDMQKAIAKLMGDYVDQNSSLISNPFTQYLKTLGVNGPVISIQIEMDGTLTVVDKE